MVRPVTLTMHMVSIVDHIQMKLRQIEDVLLIGVNVGMILIIEIPPPRKWTDLPQFGLRPAGANLGQWPNKRCLKKREERLHTDIRAQKVPRQRFLKRAARIPRPL